MSALAQPGSSVSSLLPREHGAWGLLFQPFAAAILVAGTWTWLYLPALGLVLLGFLVREPLVVWLRHRWLWKKDTAEARLAVPWALALLGGIGLCALALLTALPWQLLAIFLATGLALSVVSVVLTLKNQQRSILLQTVSAAGLSSSALLVAFAATGEFPRWAWLLWAVLAAHAMAAIPVVPARLQMKARKPSARRLAWLAGALQFGMLLVAAVLWQNHAWLWVPVAFSALANGFELARLLEPENLGEPIQRVGLRLLAVSLLHTVLGTAIIAFPV